MRLFLLLFVSVFVFLSTACADNGLINIKSRYDVKETADRLEKLLKEKGMTVFIRINHAEGAQKVGEKLRPTELVVFGNPKAGTPLMQCRQSAAIDLPQKALIYEDDAGQVWFSYNDPHYLADRHGMTQCTEAINKVGKALSLFARQAAGTEK